MKILILTEEFYPYVTGGGTTYINLLKRGFDYCGIDYEILAPEKYSSNNNFIIRNLANRKHYRLWMNKTIDYLEKDDKWKEFDAINVHEFVYSGELAIRIKERFGIPIVLTSHGIYSEGLKARGINKFIVNYCKRKEKELCQKADYIIGINHNVTEFYRQFNKKVSYLPDFIDSKQFSLIPRNRNINTIAFIGRLSKEKNVDSILQLAFNHPEKNFLIIGDGDEREYLEQQKLSNNIKFIGEVSYKDIPQWHNNIDLMINFCPSETFGLAVLEGMASGIPAITFDINEFHNFVGESKAGEVLTLQGVYLEGFFNEALKKIDENYQFYSENAVRTAKEYDYRNIVPQYEAIFRSLK